MTGFITGARLPEDIERGAVGGPRFNTTVLELESGFEKRNVNWTQARGEWDVGYGLLLKFEEPGSNFSVVLDDLINFFYIMQGKAFSFRFKDWSDYEIAIQNGVDQTPQQIGLGDDSTTTFQVFKRYASAGTIFDRTITKLVSGTVEVFIDGVKQVSGFTVDHDRGLVDFTVAPASTGGTGPGGEEVVAVRCEFDVHARFDTDDLKMNMEVFNAGSWPNIPVVELRGNGID